MPEISDLLHSIMRLNRLRALYLRRLLAPYHLCGTMHMLLLYLHRHPGACQDAIAETYPLDKATVAREAQRLEELGLLRRSVVSGNRRQYALENTAAGEALVQVILDGYARFSACMTRELTPEQQQTAAALLKKMSLAPGLDALL